MTRALFLAAALSAVAGECARLDVRCELGSGGDVPSLVVRRDYDVAKWWRPKTFMGRDFWPLFKPGFWTVDSPEWKDAGAKLGKTWPPLDLYREAALIHDGTNQYVNDVVRDSGGTNYLKRGAADYKSPVKLGDFFPEPARTTLYANPKPDAPVFVEIQCARPAFRRVGNYEMDFADFAKWKAAHPNFMGFRTMAEFDSDTLTYELNVGKVADPSLRETMLSVFGPCNTPASRFAAMREAVRRTLPFRFGEVGFWGMFSSSFSMGHQFADLGASGLFYEATSQSCGRWQVAGAFLRGAARQFDIPYGWYVATWCTGATRDGEIICGANSLASMQDKTHRPLMGAGRNSANRQSIYGWLIGSSFMEVEGPHRTHLEQKDGKPPTSPSGYAKDMDALYRLSKTIDRGAVYAPCAILTPLELRYTSSGSPWFGGHPYAFNAFFYTLAPVLSDLSQLDMRRAGNQSRLYNSRYGEFYDVLVPDSDQPAAKFLAALSAYKVAFLIGEYDAKRLDKASLAAYVRGGGTLVVSSDKVASGLVPADLAGVKFGARTTPSKGYGEEYAWRLPEGTPSARPLERDDAGTVVLWAHDVGRGRLVTAAADHFLPDEYAKIPEKCKYRVSGEMCKGDRRFTLVSRLLDRVQRETMPVAVDGDVQWGVNRTADGWRVWLINNKGVTKYTFEEESFDASRTADVTVRFNDSGRTVYTSVGPGEWKIVQWPIADSLTTQGIYSKLRTDRERCVCTAKAGSLPAVFATEWIAGSYCPPPESDTPAFLAPARNDVVERAFRTRDVEVASAVWRIAAPGMRDLFVNGERVSSTALPPLTPYRKRILEETFDVTAQVRKGAVNALRIELGNGWYNLLPLKMWYVYNLREHMATGTPCVKATLEIAYADGVREKVATDASWRAAKGRLVHNSIYLGVVEDRRLSVDFAENARVVEGPSGRVVDAGAFPKVVVYDKWNARSVTQISNGVWLVDMGVNATGTLRVKLRGVPRGGKVRLRQGERIWPDGTVNVMTAVAGQIKNPAKGPLFAVAEQRDSVIGDGSQEFVFEPRMTFHVFRYVQVEGPCATPKPEDFEICAWSADVRERSHFTCSNERLNNLHDICRRTFRSNLQGVQSDCPGREKFGYGGDIACTLDAFWSNYDMADFYRKTLRDFLDEAEDDGLFTETAPFVGIASRSVYPVEKQTPNSMLAEKGTRAAPIGWAVGVPVIVDSLVRYDGDLDSVRLAYPALVRFIDLIARRYPSNDIPDCLGDWIAIEPEKANCGLSGLAHWHQFVTLTAKFARMLGKTDDAERLANLAERIAAKFRTDYVHENGRVGSGFQGEQLFALYHGLLEPKDVPAAYELLKKDIHAHGDALTTGIFATKYMFEYLPLHGDAALAARVAMHEGFPGWFHMVDRGATTLWENWSEEKSVNVHSNCHPMFGSVDEWLIRHVLGISVCEDAVGCDKIRIAPQPIPGVTSASGWFDTPKGRIAVSWRIVDGKLDVKSDVPNGIKVVPPPDGKALAGDGSA